MRRRENLRSARVELETPTQAEIASHQRLADEEKAVIKRFIRLNPLKGSERVE
jgi:hypothetical protein